MGDLKDILAILQEANKALLMLDKMGLRLTGVLDLPVLLKVLGVNL